MSINTGLKLKRRKLNILCVSMSQTMILRLTEASKLFQRVTCSALRNTEEPLKLDS